MEYPNFKVLVRCYTFNQIKYISETLDGFCIQQTNFPFICCVVDDASTDGEPELIKQYQDKYFAMTDAKCYQTEDYCMTYARHKNNKNCFFAVYYLKYNR